MGCFEAELAVLSDCRERAVEWPAIHAALHLKI